MYYSFNMKPHTLIPQRTPSKLLTSVRDSEDPRIVAWSILALEAKGVTSDKIKEALTTEVKGVNTLNRIMQSSNSKFESKDRPGQMTAGSRRASLSSKRVDVIKWAVDHDMADDLLKPSTAGVSPLAAFAVTTQAWNPRNAKAGDVFALISDRVDPAAFSKELTNLGASEKECQKMEAVLSSLGPQI